MHRDRRRPDDPERGSFGRHRGEDESHRHGRHHESRHPEIHERVDVLHEPADERHALEVEHLEVVEIQQHEREQRQQLHPLTHVAQEHLHVLDEQLPPHRRQRQRRGDRIERAEVGEARLRRLLRPAVSGEVPPLVRPGQHDRERTGRGPQRGLMQPVHAALDSREERLARPERRQQRRDRRLQRGEEVGDVGQRLDAQQPLGLDEAQQQHDAGGEDQAHEHQQVARAPRRKHVDERTACTPSRARQG